MCLQLSGVQSIVDLISQFSWHRNQLIFTFRSNQSFSYFQQLFCILMRWIATFLNQLVVVSECVWHGLLRRLLFSVQKLHVSVYGSGP